MDSGWKCGYGLVKGWTDGPVDTLINGWIKDLGLYQQQRRPLDACVTVCAFVRTLPG